MPVTTRIKKLIAAISPRKKVEWTGNALRPYFCWRALSCRRSSSHPTLLPRAADVCGGAARPPGGGGRCVLRMAGGHFGPNGSPNKTLSGTGAVRPVGGGETGGGAGG